MHYEEVIMKTTSQSTIAALFIAIAACTSWGDWTPVQPIPIQSAINAIDHFPSTTVVAAVADSGIVYRSTDAGVAWDRSQVAADDLNDITCYGDQFAVIAGDNGTVYMTTSSGSSWSTLTIASSDHILSVAVLDDSILALGFSNGTIWTTQNRGDTWTIGTTPDTNAVYAIDYVNATEIWAAAGATAWRSTNGGTEWNTVRTFDVDNLTDVEFLDQQVGFVCGIGGDVFRTLDNGTTWDSTDYYLMWEPASLVVQDSSTVRVIDRRGYILRCTGSFHSWNHTRIGGNYSDMTYLDWQDIFVAAGGQGDFWGAGGYGTIAARSTDQGDNWTYTMYNQEMHIRSVYFLNENEGWAAGGVDFQISTTAPEIVTHTTDGGSTWNTILSESGGGGLTDVYFIDSDTGWAAGSSRIWRTNNGGMDWEQTGTVSANDLSFINNQEGWQCGLSGTIRHTTNGGETWDAQYAPSNADYLYSIEFVDNQLGWCTGYNWQNHTGIILHTLNGGTDWYYQFFETNTTGFRSIRSIDMWDSDRGIAVSIYGTILETTTGDTTWAEITAPDSTSLNSVSYQDENNILAAGDDGYIIIKTAGGSWQVDTVLSEHRIMDIYAVNEEHRFAATDQGIVLVYTPPQSVDENKTNTIPNQFTLQQNYPNPFNPTTNIHFDLLQSAHVTITVYNVLGQKIATLINDKVKAGHYTSAFDGSDLASGIYLYRMVTDQFSDTKKMVLLK